MTVYVDDANIRFGRMIMCHMCADTVEELHEFAKKIRINKEWYLDSALSRYIIVPYQKEKAIELGAKEVSKADFVFLSSAMKKKG